MVTMQTVAFTGGFGSRLGSIFVRYPRISLKIKLKIGNISSVFIDYYVDRGFHCWNWLKIRLDIGNISSDLVQH